MAIFQRWQDLWQQWSRPPKATRALVSLAVFAVLVESFYAIIWRENDFSVHLRYGHFFLEGAPYQSDGATAYYPLARLWFDAGLASLEYYTSRTLCYLTAIGFLILSMVMWERLARPAGTIPSEKRPAAFGWTIFILSPFIVRDLDECGLQLLLLFFLTAAGYCLAHRRTLLGGFYLAVAIVYKATPLFFIPFLLWKRQWKATAWTVLFTLVLSVLPATYLGWEDMLAKQQFWFERTVSILEKQQAYPSVPGLEAPKVQNESLKALVARYLTSYEPSHPLYLDHPLFFQFGDLSGRTARWTVTGIILLLGAVIGLRMWGPWREPPRPASPPIGPRFAPDWAVACLFAALLSPICWRQHLVVAIPCAYLVARERLRPGASRDWRKWLPVAAALILLGSRREIWGQELSILFLSYKVNTIAILSYVVLCLTLPTRNRTVGEDLPVPDHSERTGDEELVGSRGARAAA